MSTLPSARVKGRSLAHLTAIAARGGERAAAGLSALVGREIAVDATGIHLGGTARLLDLIGGPEAPVAGVYLAIGDSIRGHIMLLFTLEQAFRLVDQLLEAEPGATRELDPMSQSALGEVGNITGAAFLNELGDAIGIELHPSPPTVVLELAGALLDSVLTEISALGGDVLVVETVFREAQEQIQGFILITPEPEALQVILDRLQEAA